MQDIAKPTKGKIVVLILLTGTITLLHFLVPTDQHTSPLHEPVVWYGPIVMNTHEELRVAFDEYAKDTFVKHP